MTCMPSAFAALATMPPMAPSPMTPSVLPASSQPANAPLPASTSFAISARFSTALAQLIPSTMPRDASSSAQTASSLTALALAPGVLNTTTPASAHFSTGILLTPAPARAMASSSGLRGISCSLAERTIMASGAATSSPTVYLPSKTAVPTLAILFISLIFIRKFSSYTYFFRFSAANFFMNATSFSTPSMGMAL